MRCCWGSHIYQCVVRTNMPLSILQKLNIYWPTKSLLTVDIWLFIRSCCSICLNIFHQKPLYLMFILLLLFYLPSIYKTPLQSLFAPHFVLCCIVLRLSYCIKWSQIIFLPQSNFYYCFTINTITHGKTSFAASAGSLAAKLGPSFRHQTANVGYKNISIDDWKQPLMGWLKPSELSGSESKETTIRRVWARHNACRLKSNECIFN